MHLKVTGTANGELIGLSALGLVLEKIEVNQYRYKDGQIPLNLINVLPQPRKTFENIKELAQDIAHKNLLNPPTIAMFHAKHCSQYLNVINHIWGTDFGISDLTSFIRHTQKYFYILIAGERRLRACRLLWEKGCDRCLERYGEESAGRCFQRHFGDEKISVRLCVNIPALSAIFLQFSENIHMRVPPHEEAYAYYRLFRLVREAEPDFSLSRFARLVGRNPETIRNALKFCELPVKIREYVEKGDVAYGVALEVSRLQDEGEETMLRWVVLAQLNQWLIPELRNKVAVYLNNKKMGQRELTEVFSEEQQKLLEKPHFRIVVEKYLVEALYRDIHYFGVVLKYFEEGKLGKDDSPFSERSPVKLVRRKAEMLEKLLPHLKQFIPKKEYPKIEETLQKTLSTTNSILSGSEKTADQT